MASLKEIQELGKNGHAIQAYELAKADLEKQEPWGPLLMGWSLYYLMEKDTENKDYSSLVSHLNELQSFSSLSVDSQNSYLFEQIIIIVANFIKDNFSPTDINTPIKLSTLFSELRGYSFNSSWGYSFLLQIIIKCDSWQEMADFIDWWNLDKLSNNDYLPHPMQNGRTIMSLAERVCIAQSKALLRLNDLGRIEEFLPWIDNLMANHPEMTYPGYFYGKLLLALGGTAEDALKVIVPFARRKATEFWVWQLLSDVFVNDQEKQLACLIRAVHCRTQEKFLGKVRIKLATLCIQMNLHELAKFQIDKVTQCYLLQGFRLPYEVDCWIHQPWINSVTSSDNAPLDYMAITNDILGIKTEESFAVVTFVDPNSKRVGLVYGYEKHISQRLRIKVETGVVLKINYITEPNGKIRILSSGQTPCPDNLDFAKVVGGTIIKRNDKDFAFLKTPQDDYYISPNIVRKYGLQDSENVKGLLVYDYNKKKGVWDWVCISIKK